MWMMPGLPDLSCYRRIARCGLGISLLLAFPAVCSGQQPDTALFHGVEVASDRELDDLRGGFVLENGMTVNISIDKTIFTNGVRTHASYFEIPEQLLAPSSGQLNPGNSITDNVLGSITQNSLNNQLIEVMRIVNIEILNVPNVSVDTSGQRIFDQFMTGTF